LQTTLNGGMKMKSKRYAKEGTAGWTVATCNECGEKFKSDVISVDNKIYPIWKLCWVCVEERREVEKAEESRNYSQYLADTEERNASLEKQLNKADEEAE